MEFSLAEVLGFIGLGSIAAYCAHSKYRSLDLVRRTEIYRTNMRQIDSAVWDPAITFKWLSLMAPNEDILCQLERICSDIHFDGDCLVNGIELFELNRCRIACTSSHVPVIVCSHS